MTELGIGEQLCGGSHPAILMRINKTTKPALCGFVHVTI
jgi:hypothetical protein